MYASSEDPEEQKTISKSLYYVENKKQLIAAFFSVLENLTDLQQRFITLKLALRISRPAFLFEYLSCAFQLEVHLSSKSRQDKRIVKESPVRFCTELGFCSPERRGAAGC